MCPITAYILKYTVINNEKENNDIDKYLQFYM